MDTQSPSPPTMSTSSSPPPTVPPAALPLSSVQSVMEKSLLSDKAILQHMAAGSILIYPFVAENLATSSYDVTLGPWYYRESDPEPGTGIYNPYSQQMVKKVWGHPRMAELASEWCSRTGIQLENIHADDRIIWLKPGETILGHTNEFVGGRKTVTTMMKARSSMGRNFIEVCKCAGWGDIGYCSRWTMEVTNNSLHYSIPLIVGRRIAQIVFFDSIGTLASRSYVDSGKYQSSEDIEKLLAEWSPDSMLPKLYLDREIQEGGVEDPLPVTSPYSKRNMKMTNGVNGANNSANAGSGQKKQTDSIDNTVS